MKNIQAVLFDLGNVLVDIDIDMFWRSLGFPDTASIAPFAKNLKAWATRYEAGELSTSEFLKGLQNILGPSYPIPRLLEAFENIIRTPIPGMEEVVAEMSRQYRTALVSNTNEIHHLVSKATVPALALLPTHFVSYTMKILKPNPEYYEAILRDLKIPPESIVFIDDLPENVKAAVAVGMQGIRFCGVEDLRFQLEESL